MLITINKMVDRNLSDEVVKLLQLHPNLICETKRIKCSLTGHEMPYQAGAIRQHVAGKKYKRLTKDLDESFFYEKYQPHLIQSIKPNHENQLFCMLTLKHVNKVPAHVKRHVEGRRFLKAKARWENCQQTNEKFVPTPHLSRQQSKHNDGAQRMEDDKGQESDDSYSDLYPEKYFERLTLSSDNEEKNEKKTKPKKVLKKRKKVVGKLALKQEVNKIKRKSGLKERDNLTKKQRLSSLKKSQSGELLTFE